MKQIIWSLLGAGIIWFVSRRHMDSLYGEISRLREADRQRNSAA